MKKILLGIFLLSLSACNFYKSDNLIMEDAVSNQNLKDFSVKEEKIILPYSLENNCKQLSLFSEYSWFEDVQNVFWEKYPDFPYDDSRTGGKRTVFKSKRLQGCFFPDKDSFVFFVSGYPRKYVPIYRYTISKELLEESPESNLYNIFKFNLIEGNLIYFSGGGGSGECGTSKSGKYNLKENSVTIYSHCSRCIDTNWECDDDEFIFYSDKDNTASILKYRNKEIDVDSFVKVNKDFSKDKNNAYYKFMTIKDSDGASFEVINDIDSIKCISSGENNLADTSQGNCDYLVNFEQEPWFNEMEEVFKAEYPEEHNFFKYKNEKFYIDYSSLGRKQGCLSANKEYFVLMPWETILLEGSIYSYNINSKKLDQSPKNNQYVALDLQEINDEYVKFGGGGGDGECFSNNEGKYFYKTNKIEIVKQCSWCMKSDPEESDCKTVEIIYE